MNEMELNTFFKRKLAGDKRIRYFLGRQKLDLPYRGARWHRVDGVEELWSAEIRKFIPYEGKNDQFAGKVGDLELKMFRLDNQLFDPRKDYYELTLKVCTQLTDAQYSRQFGHLKEPLNKPIKHDKYNPLIAIEVKGKETTVTTQPNFSCD